MGLILDLPAEDVLTGVAAQGVYARILDYNGSKDRISIRVVFYHSKELSDKAKSGAVREITVKDASAPITGNMGPLMAYLYTYLKTQPGFTGAIDA